MSVLPMVFWPDPRLREVCAAVAALTPEIETLARDMLDTMYAAQGRGLAAPQVGVMKRLFVMDAGWKEGQPDPIILINPVLDETGEDFVTRTEGCLSIPGVSAEIRRPAQVRMQWTGLDESRHVQSFSGFAAACVQHELDHLDGVVTFDHLDVTTRGKLEAAYRETAT